MIKKKPMSSKELLIKHVEFAAEFGRLPLWDPAGRTMPFYKYYLLDIFMPIILAMLLIFILTFYYAYRMVAKMTFTRQKFKTD